VQFMISRRSFWLSPALVISVCDCALLLCFCLRPKWPLRGADCARRLHGAALPTQWRGARATRVAAEVACLRQAAGGSRPNYVVALGGGGKEARDARIKSKRSSCLYFLCAR
jgi:hypothetical protein